MKPALAWLISIVALIFLLTLPGCKTWINENDLTSQICTNHCTNVSGQFVTNNGKSPLSNVSITLYWINQGYGNSDEIIREKATAKTDAKGYFQLKFTLRNDELNNGTSYGNWFYFSFDTIDSLYFDSRQRFTLPKLSPDTVVFDRYLIPGPGKAVLDYAIANPSDINSASGDNLMTTVKSEYGNLKIIPVLFFDRFDTKRSSWIPVNQPVIIETNKIKQGITTTTYDTLTAIAGEHIPLTITF